MGIRKRVAEYRAELGSTRADELRRRYLRAIEHRTQVELRCSRLELPLDALQEALDDEREALDAYLDFLSYVDERWQ